MVTIVDELSKRRRMISALYVSSSQVVYTPAWLVDRILDRFPKRVWSNPDLTWCEPALKAGEFSIAVAIRLMDGLKDVIKNDTKRFDHITKNMLYGYAVDDISALVSRKTLYGSREIQGNVFDKSFIDDGSKKMEFDIELMNPPFQPSKTKLGDTRVLWPQFVDCAFKSVKKDGGYVVFISPTMRGRKYLKSLRAKGQVTYLEIHNNKALGNTKPVELGIDVFGVWTGFDCYVVRTTKNGCTEPTQVRDFEGNVHEENLMDWPFFPGAEYKFIKSLLVTDKDARFEGHYSSNAYHLTKKNTWMHKTKTKTYRNPIVNSIRKNGEIDYQWSCRRDRGHFGEPKVIITDNGYINNPINDFTGTFGMSQHGFGITISSRKEGDMIVRALLSDTFNRVVWSTKFGASTQTDFQMFTYFKKDWYKIVLEEDAKRKKNAK